MRFQKRSLAVLLCLMSLMLLCFGLTACGTKKYKVTLDYDQAQGSIVLSPTAQDNKYEEDSKVTVTVTAKNGYTVDTFTVSTDAKAGLTNGKYELTVSADTTVKATFKADVAVTEVKLDQDTLELEVGGIEEKATATLVATVLPDNATDKEVTWTSDHPDIAEVSGGIVTAKAEGEATITATAGGKSATCTVTVTQHVHTAKDATYYKDTENNKHYQLCECGARVNESEHNLKINADKTKFECEQCDYEEAHTHDTELQSTGANGHKTVCKTEGCGYESAVTAHSAKDATYQKEDGKHYQLCECGAKVNEAAHSAAEGAEWKQDTANNQHYKECVCGEHVEVAAHSAKDATYQKEDGKHYQLCVCGAKVNEAAHSAAEGAEWKQDTANNQHYKECVCGEHVEVAAHSAKDDEWLHDDGNETTGKHWQVCICGVKVNESAHDMDPEATPDSTGHHFECTTCDFQTTSQAHVNAQGTWKQGESLNDGHYYICSVCDVRVTEPHGKLNFTFRVDGMYQSCSKCDYAQFASAHDYTTLTADEDGTHHHYACAQPAHLIYGCTYTQNSVLCKDSDEMTWNNITAEGHGGVCACGNSIANEPHDTEGVDGACSVCGYKDYGPHVHKDDPDAYGFYDGLCDDDGEQLETPVWTVSGNAITAYNGSYAKLRVPDKIAGVEITELKAIFKSATCTDIIVSDSVTTIASQIFLGASSLKTLILGAKVSSLPTGIVMNCTNLESIIIKSTNFTFGSNCWGAKAGATDTTPKNMKVYFNMDATTLYEKINSLATTSKTYHNNNFLTKYFCYYSAAPDVSDAHLQSFGGAWHYDEAGTQIGDVKISVWDVAGIAMNNVEEMLPSWAGKEVWY